jgi:hypothetical protein
MRLREGVGVNSYSQFGEDVHYVPTLPEHGRLLDVGAGPPVTWSNSRALIEKGWDAVLIEPSPKFFMELFKEYQWNERVQLANCAVGLEWGLRRFWYTEDVVSTIDEVHYERWRTSADYIGMFTSIDVEGGSGALVEAAVAAKPQIIMVEHENDAAPGWIMQHAPGYTCFVESGVNLVLLRK